MRYGLPYCGSKNKLAERIVALLPPAAHLYDVFCGGGAVTHCALLSGKWGCVHFSDITDSVVLLRDCFEGNLPDGSEWISREAFFARKDTDPYVRLFWSFGNNQREYMYSREIEPYKKAVHEMIFAPTPNERRLKFRKVCELMSCILANNRGGEASGQTRIGRKVPWYARAIEHEEKRHSLSRPFCGGQYEMRVADYRDIDILPDSIIYADKPYINTTGYGNNSDKDDFDHETFYTWASAQKIPVFVSEYKMPEGFTCIAEFDRVSSLSSTNNSLRAVEKIFLPDKWLDWWESIHPKQKTLFDSL